MPEPPTDQAVAQLPPENLKAIVQAIGDRQLEQLPGDLTAGIQAVGADPIDPKTQPAKWEDLLYGLFKFLTHPTHGRSQWTRLAQDIPGLDRDQVVLHLWQYLESQHAAGVERIGHSVAHHRAWLFGWFRDRYDLRRARRVLGSGVWSRGIHLPVAGVLVLLLCLRQTLLDGLGTLPWVLAAGAPYLVAVSVLAATWRGHLSGALEALVLASQSFLPRLAGAAAVGLVLLASSEELLRYVVTVPWPWLVLPLVAAYGYLLLEMTHRVHPLPPLGRLALHGLDVGATGLAHAVALTLLAENGLARILDPAGAQPLGWPAVASVTVFLFSLGLVVNLIWAEQPVTEPL